MIPHCFVTGGSFHATPHNMDEVRKKVVGNAVVFDGENDYLELPSILIPPQVVSN